MVSVKAMNFFISSKTSSICAREIASEYIPVPSIFGSCSLINEGQKSIISFGSKNICLFESSRQFSGSNAGSENSYSQASWIPSIYCGSCCWICCESTTCWSWPAWPSSKYWSCKAVIFSCSTATVAISWYWLFVGGTLVYVGVFVYVF